jgi:hypothetical protein
MQAFARKRGGRRGTFGGRWGRAGSPGPQHRRQRGLDAPCPDNGAQHRAPPLRQTQNLHTPAMFRQSARTSWLGQCAAGGAAGSSIRTTKPSNGTVSAVPGRDGLNRAESAGTVRRGGPGRAKRWRDWRCCRTDVKLPPSELHHHTSHHPPPAARTAAWPACRAWVHARAAAVRKQRSRRIQRCSWCPRRPRRRWLRGAGPMTS